MQLVFFPVCHRLAHCTGSASETGPLFPPCVLFCFVFGLACTRRRRLAVWLCCGLSPRLRERMASPCRRVLSSIRIHSLPSILSLRVASRTVTIIYLARPLAAGVPDCSWSSSRFFCFKFGLLFHCTFRTTLCLLMSSVVFIDLFGAHERLCTAKGWTATPHDFKQLTEASNEHRKKERKKRRFTTNMNKF